MSKNIRHNINGAPWMIHAGAGEAYLGLVFSILKGSFQPISSDEILIHKKSVADVEISSDGKQYALINAEGQRMNAGVSNSQFIHLVSLKDPIVKYDEFCGPTGTETIASAIRASADNPNCAAIILDVDSPGGAADAVSNPSDAITYAKSKKPVIAYCGNGMTCSAAYWIACHADEMYATFSSDTIGSIGTYVTLVDWEKAYSSMFDGAKVESVYATKSTLKNDGYRSWQNDNTKKLVSDHLDPWNEMFINTVKSQRPNVNDKVFTGATFMAQEAIDMGLIDGLMSFQQVIDRAWSLSNGDSKNSNLNKSNTMFGKKNAVTVLIQAKADERTEEMFADANKETNAVGLTIVETDEFTNIEDDAKNKGSQLNATQQLLIATQQKLVAIGTALGLTANENGSFTNEEGEEVELEQHASTLASERLEYGRTAGIISTKTTEQKTEIVVEADEATKKLNEFYSQVDQQLR